MPELTKEQIEALNKVLTWSQIPNSTMAYAAAMVEEGERIHQMPSKCADELGELGFFLLTLCDAFHWKPIEP